MNQDTQPPKQHIVPGSPKLWDCTGPGCEFCSDEAYADLIDRTVKQALNCKPYLGEALGGPEADVKPLSVKKLGYEWTIDATPAEVQAALDARKPATGGRVSSVPLAGERQGCGEPLTAEQLHAAGERLLDGLGNPKLTTADYVEIGEHRIPLIADPNVPEGTVYAVGSCGCGHHADYHNSRGCIAVHGFAGPECPCTTPVWRLASKATGTGEQP